ncbi:hypothetical protein AB8344_16640 [Clostridioides difficile]
MGKKLTFTWALDERVKNEENITDIKIKEQTDKLNNMLTELKFKIENELYNVVIDNFYILDCNGCYKDKCGTNISYSINNRMNITLSKKGRKSTWNDVYKIINSIQAAKYSFI